MFEFNTQRNAAQSGDMTDRTWTAEARDADGAVVAVYTLGPIPTAYGERWATVLGAKFIVADERLVATYDTLEDATEGAEMHSRGLWHGARAARSGRALPDADMLGAMAPEFGSAYREGYEAAEAAEPTEA